MREVGAGGPGTGAWNRLREGARGLLLAFDFAATGRPEASFSDLVDRLDDWEVWETAQPPLGAEVGLGAAGYLERWAAGIPSDRPVAAVLGFCAGGVFAGGVAEELRRTRATPPLLLLFDPEAPTALTLHHQFHKVVHSLTGVLGDDRVARVVEAGRAELDRATDVAGYGARLVELFEEAGRGAFAEAGLDDEYAAELTGTYRSFVSYLVAAAQVDHVPGWAPAVALSSAGPASGLNPLPPDVREALVREELRFDTGHADLLRDPAVARATAALLA
ncbi:hypothetical protein CNX65_15310 [Actinosynnema pretiosum]|uniref:Thioesterase domain-containing protein n=1 Tax=Actinosynnema pretiosum TaxID=42197 RepID=A0A290Z691_9PSEU|nr:hypothetical protein CNX65_15310 [Actinosynnema pretiosum]